MGCRSWIAKYPNKDTCVVCAHPSHLDEAGVCRLCRKQGSFHRQPHQMLDLVAANRHGQQLFFADMFFHRGRTQPAAPPPAASPLPSRPRTRQLLLFEMGLDLSQRGYSIAGLAQRADEAIAGELDEIVSTFGRAHGWRPLVIREVRAGIRILLGFQEHPGDPITATDVDVLTGTQVPVNRVIAVLEHAGLLVDDRVPAIQRLFARHLRELPAPMNSELSRWFDIVLNGSSTPPRRRPRSTITTELYIRWAMPALRQWVQHGHTSLREISAEDIRNALPDSGPPRDHMVQALRSIFTILKAHKVVFTNPTARIRTTSRRPNPPLPLAPGVLQAALDSPDPARAAVVALIAYHALRHHQVQQLKLTDIRDGRLHLPDRTIPLAQPVLDRVNTYVEFRNRRWPNTANPHLFLNYRNANALNPPGSRWLHLTLGIPGGVTAVRTDRILDEAEATDGDIRAITAMFHLSISAAERYAYSIDDTDLINKARRHNDITSDQ